MAFGDLRGSFEAGSTSPGTGFAATGSIALSVGDLIVVAYGGRANGLTVTFNNNLSLTFTALASGDASANARPVYAAYHRVTAGATLTSVTTSHASNTGDMALCVAVFEGVFDAAPLDKNPALLSDATTPFTSNLSGTLSQADELVVGYQGQGNGTADGGYGASGSFTVAVDESTGTGSNTGSCAIFRQLVAATTSIAAAVTGTSQTATVGVATFKKGGPSNVTLTPGLVTDTLTRSTRRPSRAARRS